MTAKGGSGKGGKGSKGPGSGPGSKEGGNSRALHVRVKTAKKRTLSSTLWLQRQLNDPYVAAAKKAGLRSRAAFKLSEMDDKYRFLKPGQRVVDLGAAPGGWSQVAVERVHAAPGKGTRRGRVVGIDLTEIDPLTGADFIQLDFLSEGADTKLKELLGGEADIVLSDMAASATGHRQTDHLKIMALCEAAIDFAVDVLANDGAFCAKVLRGGTENELLIMLKRYFKTVRHVKPKSSRSDSAEMYVLAQGFHRKSGDSA